VNSVPFSFFFQLRISHGPFSRTVTAHQAERFFGIRPTRFRVLAIVLFDCVLAVKQVLTETVNPGQGIAVMGDAPTLG
jgi:hypothetical protein